MIQIGNLKNKSDYNYQTYLNIINLENKSNMYDQLIFKKLNDLSKSKFRSSFKLRKKEIDYINEKGLNTISKHAYDFINKRLAPSFIPNDGKQTPMRGHPVFIAQHATATCCRQCLYKWHKIKPNKKLNDQEVNYIVNLIITWIKKEMEKNKSKI